MKKFISLVLTLVLTLSMGTVAFAAEDQDAAFTKTYKLTNEVTSNPTETFTFKFTGESLSNSNANLGVGNMPEIPNAQVTFDEGTATVTGLKKSVDVALANVRWPGVGVYVYNVTEIAGNTAGVTYDPDTLKLKVTVAYDQGTDTFYTAFVTMSLADSGNDGQTDVKTGGFENEYSAGDLDVTKIVSGKLADPEKYFDVTVTLTGDAGKTYADSYAVSGGSTNAQNPTTIAIGTPTVFHLKHSDTITIANLPYGVTYEVEEADYTAEENGGYLEPNYEWSDDDKKIDSAKDTVTITNTKDIDIDTGINMDSMPYILLLGAAFIGLVVFFSRKRIAR